MHPRLLPALAATALLVACANPPPAPIDVRVHIPPPGGRCDAGPAQSAIGQNSTGRNVEAARVAAGARMARTLRPGQMVTKEYDAERLNLDVDAKGRIVAARCG
jgi:hypothetical protein